MKSSCVSIGGFAVVPEKRLKSICRKKLEEKKENEVEGPHFVYPALYTVLYCVCANVSFLMCSLMCILNSLYFQRLYNRESKNLQCLVFTVCNVCVMYVICKICYVLPACNV